MSIATILLWIWAIIAGFIVVHLYLIFLIMIITMTIRYTIKKLEENNNDNNKRRKKSSTTKKD